MQEHIAVTGAGTMGAGIAQAALAAGLTVVLYDVVPEGLERARTTIAAGLAKQGHADAIEQLSLTTQLETIRGASLVIEAAPEQLELKRRLFAHLGALCPPPTVIASNTSSLPIAALAAACPHPARVAGLHFFNPVHRMALVEVVRAPQTDATTLVTLFAFAERLGKTPVAVQDTPGFIVNRVARPFYGEALRLLGEQVADCATLDAALQLAGGFPLGPFALMDLIGIDINFAVSQSVYEQSFYEPRYRPHPIQHQMLLQRRLGRKSGRGFYSYGEGEAEKAAEQPDERPVLNGRVLLSAGSWAPGLPDLCTTAGLETVEELPYDNESAAGVRAAFVVAGSEENAFDQALILDRALPPAIPVFVQCADLPLAELAGLAQHPQRIIGFDGLFTDRAITLAATPLLDDAARAAATLLVRTLGRRPLWVSDTPALVVPRVVAMLANEAFFALGEGVAGVEAIDLAMRLGAGHPVGPLERAAQLGYPRIVRLLDHLHTEYAEERYRVAPALRRAARLGRAVA